MAPAKAQPAPGFFTVLKHGVVLPARRYGLFLRVLALSAVLSAPVYLFGTLVVVPLEAAANPEDYGVVSDSAAEVALLMSRFLHLLGAVAAYLVVHQAAGLATEVATASAAVAACSGEHHTFRSLLRTVRGNLLGGSATILWGLVLRAACAAALLALPVVLYLSHSPRLVLLDALLAVLAFPFCFHLEAVCVMALVASVAEPGRRRGGPGALARAWRLMRGTGNRALLYVAVTSSLQMAAGSVPALAVQRLPRGTGAVVVFLVGASLKYVLNFVVDVISMVTIAAYYFECRKNEEEEKAGHID